MSPAIAMSYVKCQMSMFLFLSSHGFMLDCPLRVLLCNTSATRLELKRFIPFFFCLFLTSEASWMLQPTTVSVTEFSVQLLFVACSERVKYV